MTFLPTPLLAGIDIGTFIFVVMLMISFLGWVVNLINGSQKPAAPGNRPRQPPRPRDERLQSEIEIFLQETERKTAPQREPARQAAPRRPQPPRPPQPRREPPKPQRLEPQTKAPPSRPAAPPAAVLPSEAARPSLSTLGQSERIKVQTEPQLPHLAGQVGAQQIGHLTTNMPLGTLTGSGVGMAIPTTGAAAGVVRLLREPGGVRQAVLMNEILQRPKALRKS